MSTLLRGATSRSIRKARHEAELTVWSRNVTYDHKRRPSIPAPERSAGSPPPVSKAERRRIALRPMRRARQMTRAELESYDSSHR